MGNENGRRSKRIAKTIRTKAMKELLPGKFLALGFGNIATSNLDGVVVSAFLHDFWSPGSAIGAISRVVGKDFLRLHWPMDAEPGSVWVIDVSDRPGVQFKKLFVIFMNYVEVGKRYSDSLNQNTWLSMGLRKVQTLLQQEGVKRVDITALGTQYGGLRRKDALDLTFQWTVRLFSESPQVDLIRVTTTDFDTFIDFFEALCEMPAWRSSPPLRENLIKAEVNVDTVFEKDLESIQGLLEQGNYAPVISMCRTMIEKKVKSIYKSLGWQYPGKLFNAIEGLRSKGVLPVQIGAYFDVVRKLGNFTVHADPTFVPTRRDTELVLYLTLGVIEWQPGKE